MIWKDVKQAPTSDRTIKNGKQSSRKRREFVFVLILLAHLFVCKSKIKNGFEFWLVNKRKDLQVVSQEQKYGDWQQQRIMKTKRHASLQLRDKII